MTRFISINGLQNIVENGDKALIVKSKLFIDELNWLIDKTKAYSSNEKNVSVMFNI